MKTFMFSILGITLVASFWFFLLAPNYHSMSYFERGLGLEQTHNDETDFEKIERKYGIDLNLIIKLTLLHLLSSVIIGLVPATIANNKGRSFYLWWFFGFMIWIVALIASIIIQKDERTIAIREGTIKCQPLRNRETIKENKNK